MRSWLLRSPSLDAARINKLKYNKLEVLLAKLADQSVIIGDDEMCKIHLSHEFLQNLLFLHLVAARQAHGLLPLVKLQNSKTSTQEISKGEKLGYHSSSTN